MKLRYFAYVLILALSQFSCSSVPQETVELSKIIGNDLHELEESHIQTINLLYQKIQDEINDFIDEVYTPFIISYVLEAEYASHLSGGESIFSSMITAANNNQKTSRKVLDDMKDFLEAANNQIEAKRNELQTPINTQKMVMISSIRESYGNVIYANSTISGHLESIRKVKNAQDKAASMLGVKNANKKINDQLLEVSEKVSEAVLKAKKIDIKTDDAMEKLEETIKKLKEITNKN